ncbi:MAG: hypothetical protein ACKVQK_26695 [Burkholderiales bacterium]
MNDNSGMDTFDTIEIRRPELARSYLGLLKAQPGRPIALFAPRRVGKTFFLDHDLAPIAKKSALLPVYADVWLQRSAPLDAINHALEEALDDVTVPAGKARKLAKTAVKKVGAAGVSIELGDEPKRRALPLAPELRLDALIARVAENSGKTILLMLDEIQTLGEVSNGEAIVAALRAVMHKRKAQVAAVFTGSSQSGLAKIMSTAGAPMYQFAQLLDFPVLGDDYLRELADHFARIHHGRKPKLNDLKTLFARLGFKPALMKDIVKSMSAEGITDVEIALKHFIADDRQAFGWKALLESMEPFDRSILLMIAKQQPPMARETLKLLAQKAGQAPTVAKVRAAVERLRKAGVLTKSRGEGVQIEDRLLVEYIASQEPSSLEK